MGFEITPEGAVAIKPVERTKVPSSKEIGQKTREIRDRIQETTKVFFTTKKVGKKLTAVANLVAKQPEGFTTSFLGKDKLLVNSLLDEFIGLASQTPQFREKVIEKALPKGVKGKRAISRQLSNFLTSPITDLDQRAEKANVMLSSLGFEEKDQEIIFALSNLFQQAQPAEGVEGGGWTPPDWGGIARMTPPKPPEGEKEKVEKDIKEATSKRSEYLRERHSIYWKAAVVTGLVVWLEVQFGIGPMSDVVWPALRRKEINPPVIGRMIEKIPVVGEDIVEPVPENRDLFKADIEKMKMGPGHVYTVENFLERMIRMHQGKGREAIFDPKNWSQYQKDLFWVFDKEFEDVPIGETAEWLKDRGYTGRFEESAEIIGILRIAKNQGKTVDEVEAGTSERIEDSLEQITDLRWDDI